MKSKAYVILIAGASGSGKSTLARLLGERLAGNSRVAILNEDAYYLRQSHLAFDQRCKTNYDHPDAIEEPLMIEHLRALKAGEQVNVPVYDYQVHDRTESTSPLGPCDTLIVEGILLMHRKAVREIADIKVFIDVPTAVWLDRRISRDTVERDRTREEVIEQYEATVGPMFEQFVNPSKAHADIVIQNVDDVEHACDAILGKISIS